MKKHIEVLKCEVCDQKAEFFHSRCCNAHFEGQIDENGKMFISCEKCGKFAAWLE